MQLDRFAGLTRLSQILWRERETLELLVFRLQAQRRLLAGGDTRWLGHASRDVETLLDRLSELELNRAVASAAAASDLALADHCGMRSLIAAAPAPWPSVLERHVTALRRLASEVIELSEAIRVLLEAGLREAVRPPDSGRSRSTRALVDTAGYHAALDVNERVLHPSLVDLVRR